MIGFIERQFEAVIELLFDEDDRRLSTFQRGLRIVSNVVLLLAMLVVLIKLSLLGRDYLFEDMLGGSPVAVAWLNSFFRTSIFIVLLAGIFFMIIRAMLLLKLFIKPFELVLVIAIVKLSIGAIRLVSQPSDVSEIGSFAMKLFVD